MRPGTAFPGSRGRHAEVQSRSPASLNRRIACIPSPVSLSPLPEPILGACTNKARTLIGRELVRNRGDLHRLVKRTTGPSLRKPVVLVESSVHDRDSNLEHQMGTASKLWGVGRLSALGLPCECPDSRPSPGSKGRFYQAPPTLRQPPCPGPWADFI